MICHQELSLTYHQGISGVWKRSIVVGHGIFHLNKINKILWLGLRVHRSAPNHLDDAPLPSLDYSAWFINKYKLDSSIGWSYERQYHPKWSHFCAVSRLSKANYSWIQSTINGSLIVSPNRDIGSDKKPLQCSTTRLTHWANRTHYGNSGRELSYICSVLALNLWNVCPLRQRLQNFSTCRTIRAIGPSDSRLAAVPFVPTLKGYSQKSYQFFQLISERVMT